ncbi:MAG: TVP38/TMEM64 family protein [Candidatus Obscuribacterales bacterium]|nr:TVP38/TMEM64 family protein [Steroidobacteraceae bacterium]
MVVTPRLAAHADLWRRAALLTILCVGIVGVATSTTLHTALLQVLTASEEVIGRHPIAGAFLFVLCAAISAMLAFISVAVIVPIAVFTWGAPFSMLLLWIGWMAGGVLSYTIGRFFGRAVIGWIASAATLRKFESRVRRDAPFALVLLFQFALPSEIPGYLLGTVRYPFHKYLLALAIAELPYTVATIYLSKSLVESRISTIALTGLALISLSVGAVYLLRRHTSAAEPSSGGSQASA